MADPLGNGKFRAGLEISWNDHDDGMDVEPILPDNTTTESPSPIVGTGAPTKTEVDSLLRRKRKARQQRSCYPCKHRKVACNHGRPCKTCQDRSHPELCSYNPPERMTLVATPIKTELEDDNSMMQISGVTQTDMQKLFRKLDAIEANLEDLRREVKSQKAAAMATLRTPQGSSPPTPAMNDGCFVPNVNPASTTLPGFHTMNYLTGQTVHLGGSSVPALVMALGQGIRDKPALQDILGKSILPLFGLDNETATYPFVDLWSLANGWVAKAAQLAKTIPSDSQCLNFLQAYRETGHVIFPGVSDIAGFEHDLTAFLMNRATYVEIDPKQTSNPPKGVTDQQIYDKNFNWVGLLFAILASGCQGSNLPRKERELTSQVYGVLY